MSGPFDVEALRRLPRGTLGHSDVTILDTLGYDINFFAEPASYNNLETDADYINDRVFATHDIHHAEVSPLFPVLWEERMDQDLEQLRQELGIRAVSEGPWSWAANPALAAAHRSASWKPDLSQT